MKCYVFLLALLRTLVGREPAGGFTKNRSGKRKFKSALQVLRYKDKSHSFFSEDLIFFTFDS